MPQWYINTHAFSILYKDSRLSCLCSSLECWLLPDGIVYNSSFFLQFESQLVNKVVNKSLQNIQCKSPEL